MCSSMYTVGRVPEIYHIRSSVTYRLCVLTYSIFN